jgi:hypothetical protein
MSYKNQNFDKCVTHFTLNLLHSKVSLHEKVKNVQSNWNFIHGHIVQNLTKNRKVRFVLTTYFENNV